MANVYGRLNNGKLNLVAADVAGNYVLTDGSDGMASTLHLQVAKTSGTIGFTIKGRSVQKKARVDDDNIAFQPIPYARLNVAGTVSDFTIVSDAITDSGVFLVPCSGMDISLEYTTTNGIVQVYVTPLIGAAA